MNGDIATVTVRYPHNETNTNGCFYRSSNDTMYIIGNRDNDWNFIGEVLLRSYASWDVILHEYGHFVQDKLNITESPGGWHSSAINMYDHYMSNHDNDSSLDCLGEDGSITCANPDAVDAKKFAIKLTYAESWPSIIGCMAQQYYIKLGQLEDNILTVGDSQYHSYNGSWNDYNLTDYRQGETVEASIMGVLWDLYDNDTTETHDNIVLGHSGFWDLTVGGQPITFSAVAERFYTLYTSNTSRDNFGKLLQYYRMAPESISHSGMFVSNVSPTFT
jgi:hypothetical protein